MGVTWSMEPLSWAISPESKYFILTDICNTLQGVLIFVLFVLKRHVFRLIKKRFVFINCPKKPVINNYSSDLLIALLFSVFKFRWQILLGKSITNGSVGTNSTSASSRAANLRMNNITLATEVKDAID